MRRSPVLPAATDGKQMPSCIFLLVLVLRVQHRLSLSGRAMERFG